MKPRLSGRGLACTNGAFRARWASSDTSRVHVTGHAGPVTGHAGPVTGHARPRTVRMVRRDRRVPFVVVPRLARHVQPAFDIADFEHLAPGKDLLAFPRA